MVGKVTTGASFSGLAHYLTGDEERVAWTEARWMIGTDPQLVAREMEVAAGQSSRVEKPVYHLSLSFDPADVPTREQMSQTVDRVLRELGLHEHQAYLVAHSDKTHPHVHVMVNRVHPETGRAWSTSYDYRKIEQALRGLEREWGWKQVPGHHAREAGTPPPDRTRTQTTGEIRRSRRTGEQPFAVQVRAVSDTDLLRARSWKELSVALERHGLRFELRGRGIVITDGERYAKASSVHREASRYRLEQRFGHKLGDYLRQPTPAVSGPSRVPSPGERMGGAGRLGCVVAEAYGLKRLREEPEKEMVRRGARGTVAVARMLASDPALRKTVEAVQGYQEMRTKEAALQDALRGYNTAENKLKSIPEQEQRVRVLSAAFDRELARVYRDPHEARSTFEGLAEKDGRAVAVDTLQRNPEWLGSVVTEGKLKGLSREVPQGAIPPAVRSAAETGRQYLQAKESLPTKEERTSLRSTMSQKGRTIRELRLELGSQPGSRVLHKQLGKRAAELTPGQLGRLQRVLSPKQFSVVARAVGRAVDVVRGRGR